MHGGQIGRYETNERERVTRNAWAGLARLVEHSTTKRRIRVWCFLLGGVGEWPRTWPGMWLSVLGLKRRRKAVVEVTRCVSGATTTPLCMQLLPNRRKEVVDGE